MTNLGLVAIYYERMLLDNGEPPHESHLEAIEEAALCWWAIGRYVTEDSDHELCWFGMN